MKKFLLLALMSILFPAAIFADTEVTLTASNGDIVILNLPDEIGNSVNSNIDSVNRKIRDNGYTTADIIAAATNIWSAYIRIDGGTNQSPFKIQKDGLNAFSKELGHTIPNSQTTQNVWADSCIGEDEKIHFGGGINVGIAGMNTSSIVKASRAAGINTHGIPETLYFPTLNADLRVGSGALFMPFDVGFSISTIDSSKISSVDNAFSPLSFDYFSIGTDVRVLLFQCENKMIPKLSAGVGFNYTKGGVKIDDSTGFASLDFKAATLTFSAQASSKISIFMPFAGTRIIMSYNSVDWKIKARWSNFFGNDSTLSNAIAMGLMPDQIEFKGGSKTNFFKGLTPQVFGGLGLDITCVNLTLSGSYDIRYHIGSGAFSMRIAF